MSQVPSIRPKKGVIKQRVYRVQIPCYIDGCLEKKREKTIGTIKSSTHSFREIRDRFDVTRAQSRVTM